MAEHPRFSRPVTAHEADKGAALRFDALPLDCGRALTPVTVAYISHGTLNRDKSNAILICHALTGDQFVASTNPVTGKPGWWVSLVGPGKPIDTDRYFVICPNNLGSCYGSTGPESTDPATGQPYRLTFPMLTVRDLVAIQARLVDRLGIRTLQAVIGGSLGGMQVLEWAAMYPERVRKAIPVAASGRFSAQGIAFNEIQRFSGGFYAHSIFPFEAA